MICCYRINHKERVKRWWQRLSVVPPPRNEDVALLPTEIAQVGETRFAVSFKKTVRHVAFVRTEWHWQSHRVLTEIIEFPVKSFWGCAKTDATSFSKKRGRGKCQIANDNIDVNLQILVSASSILFEIFSLYTLKITFSCCEQHSKPRFLAPFLKTQPYDR